MVWLWCTPSHHMVSLSIRFPLGRYNSWCFQFISNWVRIRTSEPGSTDTSYSMHGKETKPKMYLYWKKQSLGGYALSKHEGCPSSFWKGTMWKWGLKAPSGRGPSGTNTCTGLNVMKRVIRSDREKQLWDFCPLSLHKIVKETR